MINKKKAAHLIKTDGLYSLIYEDMLKEANKKELSEEEIVSLLKNNYNSKKHPPQIEDNEFLKEYKRLNKENKVSNIELNEIEILEKDSNDVKKIKQELNESIKELKRLEPYETDPKDKLHYVFTGSLAVGLIFIIHNIVSLYTKLYDSIGYLIFTSYFVIIIGAVFLNISLSKKYKINHQLFQECYIKTKQLIESAIQKKVITEDELFVESNKEQENLVSL